MSVQRANTTAGVVVTTVAAVRCSLHKFILSQLSISLSVRRSSSLSTHAKKRRRARAFAGVRSSSSSSLASASSGSACVCIGIDANSKASQLQLPPLPSLIELSIVIYPLCMRCSRDCAQFHTPDQRVLCVSLWVHNLMIYTHTHTYSRTCSIYIVCNTDRKTREMTFIAVEYNARAQRSRRRRRRRLDIIYSQFCVFVCALYSCRTSLT